MPTIADLLEPEWANLIVRRDKASDVVGVGLGGQALVSAERYRQRPNSGVILKRGPQAPAAYQPGCWVLWGEGSATALGMGGEQEVVLLNAQYVLASIDSSAEPSVVAGCEICDGGAVKCIEPFSVPPRLLSSPCPCCRPMANAIAEADLANEGLIPFLQAPPGSYLVERREMPIQRGRIYIPDGVNLHTRSCEAEIIDSSADGPFAEGDAVFLAGSVSKSFWIGHRRLWVVLPGQIPARLLAEPADVISPSEGVSAGMADLLANQDLDVRYDEGDPRAPR